MSARPLRLYGSRLRPCPYLSGRDERTIVAELDGTDAPAIYETATRAGFRRSHNVIYRPACPGCDACRPVRVMVAGFTPSKSLARISRANAGTAATVSALTATDEGFALFSRYQQGRHPGGGMDNMTMAEYRSLMETSPVETFMTEFRDPGGVLIGVMLADRLGDGLSAVYSFFDPERPRQGLGTYMVMWLIGHARGLGLGHLYLGYFVAGSRKMAYKARFRPLETLTPAGWRAFEAGHGAGPGLGTIVSEPPAEEAQQENRSEEA